ncbi:MAG: GNAT family N-acetyltransferase [Candidatus Hodarchaeota archaeon]
MEYYPLTEENLEDIYQLFRNNEKFYSIPLNYFRNGTIDDEDYDPEINLIVLNPETKKPIGAFLAVIRKGLIRKNCYLKACIVDKNHQREGIGTMMLEEIIKRAKEKLPWSASIYYGDSRPNYWQPGVDLRHTSLFFFLKKHGFKTHKMRYNLTVPLEKTIVTPKTENEGYVFRRIQQEDFEQTYYFVKENFSLGFWAEEVRLSFKNNPPTTFIAKDSNDRIIGWATHSNLFPGSFGPTGVLKPLRGKGIGGELLSWCIWDMKKMGLENCTIMWVVGDIIKFYSKVLEAYIHPVFYPMSKKL